MAREHPGLFSSRRLDRQAFRLGIAIIVQTSWRRRDAGILGCAKCVSAILKYVVMTLIGILCFGTRARILISAYAWARRVDDVADGYALPPSKMSITDYLFRKDTLLFSLTKDEMRNPDILSEDVLIIYALRMASALGIEIGADLNTMWSLFLYDVNRERDGMVASRAELMLHATKQDISIITSSIKVLGGDHRFAEKRIVALKGIFTRIDCLFDLVEDLRKGVVNIPEESLRRFCINPSRLTACKSWDELQKIPGFVRWYRMEVTGLSREWCSAKEKFMADLRIILPSRFLAFIVKHLIYEFDRMLWSLAKRLPYP